MNYELISQIIENCNKLEINICNIWENMNLSEFKSGMDDVNILFIDLDNIFKDIVLLNINTISINDILLKLLLLEDAIIINDYILIGDIIYYDIKPILRNWRIDLSNYMKMNLN